MQKILEQEQAARERLAAMTMPNLRDLADVHDVTYTTRTKKDTLVELVLEALPSPRQAARQVILQAVNRYRLLKARAIGAPGGRVQIVGSRQLQRAVCIVRQNRLVPAEVLETAGFRAERKRR